MADDGGQGQNLYGFNNDDLNGECFLIGELGEVEAYDHKRVIVIPKRLPRASKPFEHVAYTAAEASLIYRVNAEAAYRTDPEINVAQAGKIAYLRFLAIRNGLVSTEFSVAEHNVRYNEVVDNLDELKKVRALPDKFPDELEIGENVRKLFRECFTDIVCTMAYMFRVRGHHWLPDMNVKYRSLWQKCLKGSNDPGLGWNFIAHNALHAIFPIVLDNFWTAAVLDGNIAGALAKRYDTAPAGTAAIRSVTAGAHDLQMAVPGIQGRFKEHFAELNQLVDKVKNNRWLGSINRRFYKADNIVFDEQKFAAIAAVIISALDAFAPDSPLLDSPSLRRVASNARITGGIIARGIATAASDPNLVKEVLRVQTEEKE